MTAPSVKTDPGECRSPIKEDVVMKEANETENNDKTQQAEEQNAAESETSPRGEIHDSSKSTFGEATELKTEGNAHFTSKRYIEAVHEYENALNICASEQMKTEEWTRLEVALRSNLAICLLRLERFQRSQEQCSKALELDPTNSKVWYRRGLAREGSEHFENAIKDLEKCLKQFPPSKLTTEQERMKAVVNGALKRIQSKQKNQQQSQSAHKPEQAKSVRKQEPRQQPLPPRPSHKKIPPKPEIVQSSQTQAPSPSQQRQDVIRLLMARLGKQKQCIPLEGEAYFLISFEWWKRWCLYTDFFSYNEKGNQQVLKLLPPGALIPPEESKTEKEEETSTDESESDESDSDDEEGGPPGVIDNSELLEPPFDAKKSSFYIQWNPHLQVLEENHLLRPNLVRGHHYELLPREVYCALRIWYGEATTSICRRFSKGLQLYPEHVQVKQPPLSQRCGACGGPNAKCRCTRCMSIYYCSRTCQESHWPFHKFICKKIAGKKEFPPSAEGRVGLNNLGNTCFMNSAIQCLSHATPLTRHFLSNAFKKDLNASNPLGTGGKLANAYDSVLKDLWMSHGRRSTSPTSLKRAIAMFAPRFAGCSQHDAQEFLAYLLDGLHEDLNRIRKAPYVEMPNPNNCMSIAGAEAWDAHMRRNDSLVMDTFYGQFKSTCICPKCDRVSVSFDAFNHVSLEIPQAQNTTRTISVLLISRSRKPARYGVVVRRSDFVVDLRKGLSELCKIPETNLQICDVYENVIYEILVDGKPVSGIRGTDVLAAYEVEPYTKTTIHTVVANVIVFDGDTGMGDPMLLDDYESDNMMTPPPEKQPFGLPFMSSFDAQLTCRQVWEHLWHQLCVVTGLAAENGHSNKHESSLQVELKSRLQMRVVDNAGVARPVFLDENLSDMNGMDSSSIVPPDSDEKMSKYLGKGCTERFLFVHLEWTEPSEEEESPIAFFFQKDGFLSFEDHPSWLEAMKKQRARNGIKGITLEQCFDTFTRPERLDEHNKWYCSKCKEHVRAMKTMQLWRLPNVLVVHLKRFEFKHSFRRDKLDNLVDFPINGLDMSKHCASYKTAKSSVENGQGNDDGSSLVVDDVVPAIYDLFAVTNHYGRMGFGHYTAFARRWNETAISNDWALFDDSNAQSIGDGTGRNDQQCVVTPAAYVLFYRRRIFN